jgi:hypothetical protein
MYKWLAVVLLAVLLVAGLILMQRPERVDPPSGDPETRIVAYLKEHVRPGQPVFVTELQDSVFTSPEEREALQRLYDVFFKIPAYAADVYTKTGKIPTRQELSNQFNLRVPGEIDVLLQVMESDPRVPPFFERDPASGEIIRIDVEQISSHERFGRPLRNR